MTLRWILAMYFSTRLPQIEAFLKPLFTKTTSYTEHQLLSLIKQAQLFDINLRQPLQLFRWHFLLFHHLYWLDQQWRFQGEPGLSIHTLKIYRYSPQAIQGSNSLSESQIEPAVAKSLQAYYLDWRPLFITELGEVMGLLQQAQQGIFQASSLDSIEFKQALKIFELEQDTAHLSKPCKQTIIRQYRLLAMKLHPDRGGSSAQLQALNAAREILLK